MTTGPAHGSLLVATTGCDCRACRRALKRLADDERWAPWPIDRARREFLSLVRQCREEPYATAPVFVGREGRRALAILPVWIARELAVRISMRTLGASGTNGEPAWPFRLEGDWPTWMRGVVTGSSAVTPVTTARQSLGRFEATVGTNPSDFSQWRLVGPHGLPSAAIIPGPALIPYLDLLDAWRQKSIQDARDTEAEMLSQQREREEITREMAAEEARRTRAFVKELFATDGMSRFATDAWMDLALSKAGAEPAVQVVSAVPALPMEMNPRDRIERGLAALNALPKLQEVVLKGVALSVLMLARTMDETEIEAMARAVRVDEERLVEFLVSANVDEFLSRDRSSSHIEHDLLDSDR